MATPDTTEWLCPYCDEWQDDSIGKCGNSRTCPDCRERVIPADHREPEP